MINYPECDMDFTNSAYEYLFNAVDDPYFRDKDAELIFRTLETHLKAIPFCRYLKRYIYQKADLSGKYDEIPIKEYQLIIRGAFSDNHTPASFESVSSKLSALSKNWLTQKTVKRNVIFLLGFGLNMSVEDVNAFLVKALREPEINFKNPFEVICWYCFKNRYNYLKFEKLWKEYQEILPSITDEEVLCLEHTINLRYSAYTIQDDTTLLMYLSKLKSTRKLSKFSVTSKKNFKFLYDCAREIVAEIFNSIEEEKHIFTKDDISVSDIEHVICSAIPLDKHGNLVPSKVSKFNEHFSGKRFSRQHLNDILADNAEVNRFDLITLNFFIFSQKVEEYADNKIRYLKFVDSTNLILKNCGMGNLYIANPYECFILMCILADDPLGTYADVNEMAYSS